MNVIVEFHADAAPLLLGHTLVTAPEMEVDVEQHTADERGLPIFFFWAAGGDYERFEASLDEDPTVESAVLLDEVDDWKLYRAQFAQPSFYSKYRDTAAKILDLRGADGSWHLRMRFPDRHAVQEYATYYDEADVPYRLDRLYEESEDPLEHRFGLTTVQHETLLLAYEEGYFRQPRAISLDELANLLGVSAQAVAGRLQRAHANLIENTLVGDQTTPGGMREVH